MSIASLGCLCENSYVDGKKVNVTNTNSGFNATFILYRIRINTKKFISVS